MINTLMYLWRPLFYEQKRDGVLEMSEEEIDMIRGAAISKLNYPTVKDAEDSALRREDSSKNFIGE